MKSLVKIGLGALLCGVALFASASLAAPNEQATADYTAIERIHAVAVSQNDRIKLNCVNEKLIEAKALLNIIDQGDASKSAELHELRVAAEGCIGKKDVGLNSDNDFSAPPGAAMPTDPATTDWGNTFEPPLDASQSMPSNTRQR